MKLIIYIDPENRLSKVPHRVPNNTHYVTLDQYQLMELQLKAENEELHKDYEALADEHTKLTETHKTLKAEVESMKKPAVVGRHNISEYIRMANSETLEFDNGDIFADMTLPERIKYIVESHSRLKADVERLKQQVQYWKIEAECDHGRWLRTLEDLEHLRKLK